LYCIIAFKLYDFQGSVSLSSPLCGALSQALI
jgi:hypothetical protein